VRFFKSNRKKKIDQAKDWLTLARKVHDYRHDILPEPDVKALRDSIAKLEQLLKAKPVETDSLEAQWNEMQPLLRRTGGSFYPKTFWAENTEMIVVAAILAIGIRTFFLQPFKIPTNSMYPSYYGMTPEIYSAEEGEPNPLVKTVRFLSYGAKNHTLEAPATGELVYLTQRKLVPGRKWLVLPTKKLRHTFLVGGQPVHVDLPPDFDFNEVIRELLGPNPRKVFIPNVGEAYRTGKTFQEGDLLTSFDLMTGDQLFVDRFSYHFIRPSVGDPFVFRTGEIEHIDEANRDKYYIKRLAAAPGDTLEIDPPGLLLNGEPITGAKAFSKNAKQVEGFDGYVYGQPATNYPLPRLSGREPIKVPEDSYVALGDNSDNSADSRMWGFVPEREIVGRAVFIYYPFTRRWGPSD